MDLTKIPLMAALKSRMQWLGENQRVLAENIANADTPGYRPKALEAQDFSALVDAVSGPQRPAAPARVAVAATDPRHFGVSAAERPPARTEAAGFDHADPNGNAVDLEKQLLGVAQTQMEYGLMTDLYRKHSSLLRTALSGSGSGGSRR